MTKTAIIRLLADAGPNTFNTFGSGADQVSRLKDGDDATGIRANATGLRSQFSIDPADIPADVDYVTQVKIVGRERFSFVMGSNGLVYECYVNAALLQSQLVLQPAETLGDTVRPLLTGAEQIIAPDLPTLEIAYFAQALGAGERWEITSAAVEITYETNAAEVELHTHDGYVALKTSSGHCELRTHDGHAVLDTVTGDCELHAHDGHVTLVAK